MTRFSGLCLSMICVSSIFVIAGCQSTPANPCAGFTLNDLSPAGTVAVLGADPDGARRVIANDRNFTRRGCS